MVFRHAPIPRKGSGKQQQHLQKIRFQLESGVRVLDSQRNIVFQLRAYSFFLADGNPGYRSKRNKQYWKKFSKLRFKHVIQKQSQLVKILDPKRKNQI